MFHTYVFKKLLILFCFIFLGYGKAQLAAQIIITPSHVYAQAEQINKEIVILKNFFKITKTRSFTPLKGDLKPRHAWQMTYVLLTKINLLRGKNNLPRIMVGSMEPVLNIDPLLTFEQTQRVLVEISILKSRLGIKKLVTPPVKVSGKQPIDVFNKLLESSLQLDLINNENITPNYVFAETMRVYEDIALIIRWLKLEDKTFPPSKKRDATPRNSIDTAFDLLFEIQRIQNSLGIQTTNFSFFNSKQKVLPSDVYLIVDMCLGELQTIKANLGINSLTSVAEYGEIKTPSDVQQLLQWSVRKLKLIRNTR